MNISQRLSQIDWKSLQHAYGDAEAAGDALAKILQIADDEAFAEGMDYIWSNLYHQGTIYDSTTEAVPFLLEALRIHPEARQELLLAFLLAVSRGSTYYVQHYDLMEEWGRDVTGEAYQQILATEKKYWTRCQTLLWEGWELYEQLLDSQNEGIQVAIPYLMAVLLSKEAELRPQQWRAQNLAQDVAERMWQTWEQPTPLSVEGECSRVFCLAHLLQDQPDIPQRLTAILVKTPHLAVRLSAALHLPLLQEYEKALPILLDALAQGEALENWFSSYFPWLWGDIRGVIVETLCLFPKEYLPHLAPSFLQIVQKASPYMADTEVVSILAYVFDGKKLTQPYHNNKLTDLERKLAQAIYDNENILSTDNVSRNATRAFEALLGISDKRQDWAALLGG
jgi:hypothetical protein